MAGLEEQALALHGRGNLNGAAVVCIGALFDQTLRFEGVHDARHGGRADLLRDCKLAEREGAGKDNDRESREAGGVQAAGGVGAPQPAQEMDGGCMQGLGGFFRIEAVSS